jgi:hypothetical protein
MAFTTTTKFDPADPYGDGSTPECVECGYGIYFGSDGSWRHCETDTISCYAEGDPFHRIATFDECGTCDAAH